LNCKLFSKHDESTKFLKIAQHLLTPM
jgi:hypothetical protein